MCWNVYVIELNNSHKGTLRTDRIWQLYQQIGIDPPRGVLMYGPPGCGKTLLAKAVAAHTTASFIRVVGSEFVQKYLGEGPRMVRDVFRLAKENSPSIIFIDEIDAIATKRFDAQTGADREVQRILLELLNQMDGFDQSTNVKVIMATNRQATLDPALLRPGRLDRKIEFPMPDRRQKRLIFSTITAKMNLSDEVDMEDFVARPDKVSGADIDAICQKAGNRQLDKKGSCSYSKKGVKRGENRLLKKKKKMSTRARLGIGPAKAALLRNLKEAANIITVRPQGNSEEELREFYVTQTIKLEEKVKIIIDGVSTLEHINEEWLKEIEGLGGDKEQAAEAKYSQMAADEDGMLNLIERAKDDIATFR
ncbi:unnamed protein product, partial [Toxocara canis]|uniref:AAA domain-containing protein n=1 Tax=Toxocara canis TaxID=6265 RepID=A0A183UMX4_TOXCA